MRPFIAVITAAFLLALGATLMGCGQGNSPEGSKTSGTSLMPGDQHAGQTKVESPSTDGSERSSAVKDKPLTYDPNWVLFKQHVDNYKNFNTGKDSNEN